MKAKQLRLSLLLLCLYQLLFWFRPSEPYLADVLQEAAGISNNVTFSRIYPWSTYSLLPAAVIIGLATEVLSVTVLLFLASLCSAVAALLVVLQCTLGANDGIWLMYMSEVFWALGFTSSFLVSAVVYHWPSRQYRVAITSTRSTALLSTVASSLVGYMLRYQQRSTIYISFASVATAAIVSICLVSLLPSAHGTVSMSLCQWRCKQSSSAQDGTAVKYELREKEQPGQRWKQFRQSFSYLSWRTGLWAGLYAGTLWVHALALTYWPTLFNVIAPGGVSMDNGLISALCSAVAAGTTLVLPSGFLSVSFSIQLLLFGIAFSLSGLCLWLMQSSSDITTAGCLLGVYHAISEGVLATLRILLGKSVTYLLRRTRYGDVLQDPLLHNSCLEEQRSDEEDPEALSSDGSSNMKESKAGAGMALGLATAIAYGAGDALQKGLSSGGGSEAERRVFRGYAFVLWVVAALALLCMLAAVVRNCHRCRRTEKRGEQTF